MGQSDTYVCICVTCMIICMYHISTYISQTIHLYMSVKVKDHMPVFTLWYFTKYHEVKVLGNVTQQNNREYSFSSSLQNSYLNFRGFVFLTASMHEQNEDRQKFSHRDACRGDTTERSLFLLKNIFQYQPSIPLSSYTADYLLNTLTIVGASNTLSSVTSMHTNLFSSLILALLIDKVQFSERLNLSLYSGTSSYCTLFFVEDLKAINTGEPSGFS